MNIEEIETAVRKIDISTIPWSPTFVVGTCSETGRPKISCALRAPDTHAEGLPVQSGVKAGGLWPPHTVTFDAWDDFSVHYAALEALQKAVAHEVRENYKVGGKLFADPHLDVSRR